MTDEEWYDGPDCWEGLDPAAGVLLGVGLGAVIGVFIGICVLMALGVIG
jgi:hypothetical protein